MTSPPVVKVNPGITRPGTVVLPKPVVDPAPGAQITNPQPVVCKGGKVRNGACVYSGQTTVIGGITSGAARVYRCVPRTVTPVIVTPKPVIVRPTVACAGGVVRSSHCICPGGTSLKGGVCRASTVPVRTSKPGAAPTRTSKPSKAPVHVQSSQGRARMFR